LAKVAAAQRPGASWCSGQSRKAATGLPNKARGLPKKATDPMALDATLMGYWRRALDASKAAAGAEQAEQAHEDAMLRARSEKNVHNYKALIAIGQLDAWRQKRYLESGRTLGDYKSVRAFFKHVLETLKTEEIKLKVCLNNAIFFWTILHAFGPLELKDGATIARGALDKANWTTKVVCSKFADPSTLDFILNGGFAEAFLMELRKQGHGVETLDKKAKAMLNGTTDAPAKAPAKKPRRRSKKAAPAPAETTSENELDEEATEKAPKAKAAARRARKKATEPVETTTTTATTPTNDGLITALKERVSSLERELDAHKTTFELREANSKSKISALESKLESSEEKRAVIEAELAASEEAKAELAEELKVSKLARTRLQKRHDAILRKLDRTLDENTNLNSTLAENAPRIALADVNA
jgi:hypothetical protein